MPTGTSAVAYDEAVSQAQRGAQQAVTEDRVPRRYHGTIKKYFQELPPEPIAADDGAP